MLTSPAPLNCGGNTFCSKVGKPTLLKSKTRDVEAKENQNCSSRNVVWEPQVFLGEVSTCIYCAPASQLAQSSLIPFMPGVEESRRVVRSKYVFQVLTANFVAFFRVWNSGWSWCIWHLTLRICTAAPVSRVFLQYGEEKSEDKHVLVNTSQDPHFQWAFSGAGIPEWMFPL